MIRDDAPTEIDKGVKRDNDHASQLINDPSWLPRAGVGAIPRLVLIGVFAICALGVIVWLLSGPQGGANVKAGDCAIANSGTATGNTVNCGSPPTAPAAKP